MLGGNGQGAQVTGSQLQGAAETHAIASELNGCASLTSPGS